MKKKILIEGPLHSESGYGYQARFAFDAIMSNPDLDVYVSTLRWGLTSWLPSDDEYSVRLHELLLKTGSYINDCNSKGQKPVFDIYLFVGIPNEFTPKSPFVNIIYTAGVETNKVSHQWLNKINESSGVIVCSNFGKAVFEQTKYSRVDQNRNQLPDLKAEVPITVVNYGIPKYKPKDVDLDLKCDFNFLVVGQWGPRKNIENTIIGFIKTFKDNPNVGLVIKTNKYNNSYTDRQKTKSSINNLINFCKSKEESPIQCKIKLVHGNVPSDEMLSLYTNPKIKAIINIGHGEGYGLPMFEAAYSGMPVVTTGWSGESDYLFLNGEPMFQKVDFTIQKVQPEAVFENVILEDAMWAYANLPDYEKKLLQVYEEYDVFKEKAEKMKKSLEQTHLLDDKYREFNEALLASTKLTDDELDNWLKEIEVIS